jgi:hypothetical protein
MANKNNLNNLNLERPRLTRANYRYIKQEKSAPTVVEAPVPSEDKNSESESESETDAGNI